MHLKIFSYNIHKELTFNNLMLLLPRIRSLVYEIRPHFLYGKLDKINDYDLTDTNDQEGAI
ncbi:MAG: hypothetical protein A2381_11620 [Bdellovibrionales bacterium RIFOXYB1_FULL_37_110]|nr:MAG: hypothetical protein A2417_11925 [Bdellovibrionales bacterium RIFOXYC1_FULL_37_79]OFZ57337.1 MAG: hypothetical protein A2381_11620 [Bdellovibrionales bacterium RIFOXYB1_FULL_37_110]OFZ62233.1 MAG: hypothetical protein A2577_14170 [Bdellovibrionales bacterium RIFOXYD1_FULL_36_51]